jgi:hypothetical protein
MLLSLLKEKKHFIHQIILIQQNFMYKRNKMKTNYFTNRLFAYACLVGLSATAISCDDDNAQDPVLAADVVNFNNIMLSSQQEVPENTSNATGNYSLAYEKNSNVLSYTINYSGLTPTGMHFHKGDVGVAGGVEAEVAGPYSSGMKGMVTLTDAQETDLLNGKLYLNIHSAAFEAGELRGQAVMENQVVFSNIKLSGAEEVPSNSSAASGVFNGVYDKSTKKLMYSITSSGVTASSMHLHKAAPGMNGDVVMEVTDMMGTLSFTADQEADLLAGNLYLNTHSAAFAGGEIRGQLVRDQQVVFSNSLSGANEVGPTNSTATGTFYAVYDQATKKLSYMIYYEGLTPTSMHFHKAAAGANGDVVMAVEGPYSSGMMGSVTLNAEQEADLLKGLWYLNVHTDAHAGGEIRAQLVK